MKKFFTILCSVVMILALHCVSFAYAINYGDVNNDASINASDALGVLKHAAKISELS